MNICFSLPPLLPSLLRWPRRLVGSSGFEPPTSRLSGARSNQLSYEPVSVVFRCVALSACGGDDGIRTHDPLLAGQVLSQLSYTPVRYVRRESVDSRRCRHRPIFPSRFQLSIFGTAQLNFRVRNGNGWTLCVSGTDSQGLGP